MILIATIYVKSEIDKKDEAEFRFECKNITDKIEVRLHAHAQLLRSGAALFGASDTVSREDWKKFIEQSKVDLDLPGILGTGFSLRIPKDNLSEHIQKIRNEGYPEYVVWPENEREIYTSIIFLEPFSEKNIRAFGYDMMTEPVRKEAMERARDMDVASLSGKVLLVQETETDVQAGNLMYVPLYRKGAAVNTVEEKRAALIGWVYSPYRMNDLISGILSNWELEDNVRNYYLHIYDGLNYSSESLLYESHIPEEQKESENIRFALDFPIDFNGHQWTLVFTQGKGNIFIDNAGTLGVLMGGFIISVLLLLLTRSMSNTKYNAQKIAETLTVELRESEFRLKKAQEISKIGNWGLDLINNKLEWSDEIYRIFEIEPQEFEATYERFLNNIHPDDRDMVNKAYSNSFVTKNPYENIYRLKLKDGTIKHVIEKCDSIFDENGNAIRSIGTVQDISEQKHAEKRFQLSCEQYRSIFENA